MASTTQANNTRETTMAYMNQEQKNKLAPAIKAVLKKHSVKGTISVVNHSTLTVTISESDFEIERNHCQVNVYHIESNYQGELKNFLLELRAAMMAGNHDRSDGQSDYFDVGWYTAIRFGVWNKPHRCRLQTA